MKNLKNNLILNGALLVMAGFFVASSQVVNPVQAAISSGEIVAQTNALRANKGLSTLTVSSKLSSTAQMKAQDMANNGYFAHADLQGRRMAFWLSMVGYSYLYGGENLAEGFSTASGAMNGWVGSSTHYANLVKPEYTEIGVGVAQGMYNGEMTVFVVQHFATPKVAPAPAATTPVAPIAAPAPIAVAPTAPKTVGGESSTLVTAISNALVPAADAATTTSLQVAQTNIPETSQASTLPQDFYFSLLLALWLVGVVGFQNEAEIRSLLMQGREVATAYWNRFKLQLA